MNYLSGRVVRRILGCQLIALGCLALGSAGHAADESLPSKRALPSFGLVFDCGGGPGSTLQRKVSDYLESRGVHRDWVAVTPSSISENTFNIRLRDESLTSNTLSISTVVQWDVRDEFVFLPKHSGGVRPVLTVSQKEIVLALLHPGRTTTFSGNACSLQALKDAIGIRQNTVAWAQDLEWGWPDGGAAKWNKQFWTRGNLKPGRSLHVAVNDAFMQQWRYSIGCYTATKLTTAQGILDYYSRIKKDLSTLALVEARMLEDGDGLSGLESGAMWYFEDGNTLEDQARPGKLLRLALSVPATNFVPGDWSYFLNTDPITYQHTGYEGSNAIYFGRGKFDDYYNDHHHAYTYAEKLDEVYQWRNKVFSRSRDILRVAPLSARDIERLGETPEASGLVLGYRAEAYFFGFEPLPSLRQ